MTENLQRQQQITAKLSSVQKEFLLKCAPHRKFGCFLQIGGGKTFSSIAWINERFVNNQIKNALIIVPASKIMDWDHDLSGYLGQQANAFVPFKTHIIQSLSSWVDLLDDEEDSVVYLVSSALLASGEFSDFCYNNAVLLRNRHFGYVFDESSKVKNKDSKTALNLVQLDWCCEYGLLLTGSAISNGIYELATQMYLMQVPINQFVFDKGSVANTVANYQAYLKAFYDRYVIVDTVQRQVVGRGNRHYTIDLQQVKATLKPAEILKLLGDKVYLYEQPIAQRVYKVNEQIVKLQYQDAYSSLAQFKANPDPKLMPNKNAMKDATWFCSRLHIPEIDLATRANIERGLCNGVLNVPAKYLRNATEWYDLHCSSIKQRYYLICKKLKLTPDPDFYPLNFHKIMVFKQLLSLAQRQNMIVFYNRNYELSAIKLAAAWAGYEIVEINGKNKLTQELPTEEACKVPLMIIVHYKSGAMGLNLQHSAHYLTFYSPSTSGEDYMQAKGRIDRKGQDKDCVIYNLITTNLIRYPLTKEEQAWIKLNEKAKEIKSIWKDHQDA